MNVEDILPPLGSGENQSTLAAAVLLALLVVGILAGRAKNRFGLLLGGLLALVVAGLALTAATGVSMADRPAWVAALLPLLVPLVVAFLAGWLVARASWFARVIIVVVAVLVLAVFPYEAVTAATARLTSGV